MSYVSNVLRAVEYMERNLTNPISVTDVASEAAYSTFHFVRLFKALTGDTPGSYLRRRRLAEAAGELVRSRRRIIEIAIDYQFQSQEAFTRAFRDCFGINPGAFRKRRNAFPMEAARRIDEFFLIHCMEVITMEPRIMKRDAIKLIGIMYHGDNKNWEIPKLWEEFMPLIKKIPNCLPVHEAYGLCFYTESFSKSGLFYYMAALPVSSLEEIPMELVGKTLPASEYAVFTHKGPLVGKTNNIKDTYAYAYGTWLPKSRYVNPCAYDFEYYGEHYKSNTDPESELDIYIPIKPR
ncbi:MAG: AraC family transcriptional regulator [Acidobacteria bacterium]|nr:AraC family transcriptional regulator [Acidobacteriota bacterium]